MINKTTVGLLAMSLFVGSASAATITGGSTGGGTTSDAGTNSYTAGTGGYVTEDFNFNISTNVSMGITETGAAIAVATAHSDGRYHFGGSSEGGAVTNCETAPLGVTDSKAVVAPSLVTDGCAGNGGAS